MRVLLLDDGGYGNDADVTYPVEVDGSPSHNTRGDLCGVDVKKSVLRGKGFSINDTGNDTLYFSFTWSECEQVEASERRYSVHGKCCNQFGERDEIQAIIDKLSADVAERDERIVKLKQEVKELYQLVGELGVSRNA